MATHFTNPISGRRYALPEFPPMTPEEAAAIRARMAEAEARHAAEGSVDPENPPLTEAQLSTMVRVGGRPRNTPQGTVPCTLRLPREVVEFYKRGGRGWQTRAVEVLTRAMLDGTQAAATPVQTMLGPDQP